MNIYNVYGINYPDITSISILKEATGRQSWGPPDVRLVVLRRVNPKGSHGDGWFLAFPTFLVMFQGKARS